MKTLLVRLYPRRWRARYGDEFEAMLEQQPASVARVADVLLGAVDAHLTANSPERRGWWLRRLPGLVIAFGALVWSVAFAIREAGFDQDVINLACVFAPMGEVVVGLGVLALPSLWTGGSRVSRWVNVWLAVAILVGGSYIHAVHVLGSGGWTDYQAFEGVSGGFALLLWGTSTLWAAAMLARSRLPRIPLFVLAVFSAMLLGMIWNGHFGYDFNPAAGPSFSLPTEMAALAWLGIGLSVLLRTPSDWVADAPSAAPRGR
jgi:hypothetical protein